MRILVLVWPVFKKYQCVYIFLIVLHNGKSIWYFFHRNIAIRIAITICRSTDAYLRGFVGSVTSNLRMYIELIGVDWLIGKC